MRRPDDGWERPTDYYPGETVLEDLGPGVSTEDALVIVARFAALRVAILAARPEMPAEALEAERAAAIGHASVLPQRAVERRQLSEVARAVRRGRGPRGLVKLLASAGRSATERGHTRGAFALYYSAWDLAVHAGALPDAVRIARSLAEVAGREGAPRSSRLWARRARALEQRIDRAGA
ncbi:MAG: hypothetical protein ACREL7_11290 [Longimicrobiales bacterium]